MIVWVRKFDLNVSPLRRTIVPAGPRRDVSVFLTAPVVSMSTVGVSVEALIAGPDHALLADDFSWRSPDNQFRAHTLSGLTVGIADNGGGAGTTISIDPTNENRFWVTIPSDA